MGVSQQQTVATGIIHAPSVVASYSPCGNKYFASLFVSFRPSSISSPFYFIANTLAHVDIPYDPLWNS